MHTIVVLAIGFGLFGLGALAGHMFGGPPGVAIAALAFIPLWLIASGINMYIGVRSAGYSVADELPVFLIVFAIPAAAALLIWWQQR